MQNTLKNYLQSKLNEVNKNIENIENDNLNYFLKIRSSILEIASENNIILFEN